MIYSKKVIYFGPEGVSGYANATKGYIYDLIKTGSEVYFSPIIGQLKNDGTEYYKFFNTNVKKLPLFNREEKLKDADIIIHTTPDNWESIIENYKEIVSDKKIIGRTVWDFDPLPENWVTDINDCIVNVVSVPSQWCKEVFEKSGVKKEIIVEQHIIPDIPYKKYSIVDLFGGAKVFSPVNINYQRFERRVKFLNVSSLVARKNINFLIESYLDTFIFEDETLLILKLTDLKHNIKNAEVNISNIIANKIKNKDKNFAYAPIILIGDFLTFDQMQSLYDNIDIYVSVSNGEGFNIPCYNSKVKNKCVVASLHGGMVDYLKGYSKLYETDYKTISVFNKIKPNNASLMAWIGAKMKGIESSYDDVVNGLKESYYTNIQNSLYLDPIEFYQPHTEKIEESSIFPIYFKDGWHNENLSSGVWSEKTAELVVGADILKFELVLEISKTCNLKFTVDDNVHSYDLTRGQYSFKIISKSLKNIKIESSVTFDGSLINRDPNKQYGIKIIDIYVNGIKNQTSKLEFKSQNFNETILKNTVTNIDKSKILNKGEFGDVILKFKELTDSNKYPKKINLGRQLSFYSHRSGWNYVLNNLTALNSNHGVYCDGFIENNFSWRKNECVLQKIIPYNKTWIGFIHNPPNMPPWFSDNNAFNNIILQDPYFLDSLRKCKGIYTLSEYHANFIRQYIPFIPVESLYHPTEIPDLQFNFDKFVKNPEKKLITIGWWLRKLNALYTVRPEGYQKVRLMPNNKSKDTILRLEKVEELINNQKITVDQKNSVRVMDFLSDCEYDKILSENLVYLDLYDSSANNGIIECIARATPLFINRLPAVVEYLGEGYPLYIDSQFDLEEKIKNVDLIHKAHLYLRSIRYKVEIGFFLDNMVNSKIYKSL